MLKDKSLFFRLTDKENTKFLVLFDKSGIYEWIINLNLLLHIVWKGSQ